MCGSGNLSVCLDLGEQPLINNLKDTLDEKEQRFPLVLNTCKNCSHQQLSIAVDPKLMFSNYLYKTGVSSTHQEYFSNFVTHVRGSSVLDIGCNDGSLLKEFKGIGFDVLGIDPAQNIECVDIPVIKDFFPSDKLLGGRFNAITAFNVFAHNSTPWVFLEAMVELLAYNGRIYIQTTPARMGNIYHEHISYFNPASMLHLASSLKLDLKSIEIVPMHGGSHLFEFAKGEGVVLPKKDVTLSFGYPLVGYGAAANGMSLLNYYGIKPQYVIDDNPLKQGKFIPGVNVQIFGHDMLKKDPRDLCILILAYNLADEIISKIRQLRPDNRDIFIDPLTGEKYE